MPLPSPTSTSPSLDPALLELAEDPYVVLPGRPGQARLDDPRFVLRHSSTPFPLGGLALRLRLGDEPAEAVATAKEWFRGHGRREFCWCVGPSATPPDLFERLAAQGARPLKGLEVGSGMVLAEAPPAGPEDVTTRKLETLAGAEAAVDISLEAFGWPEEHGASMKETLRAGWPEDPAEREQFGAFRDGRLVAFGLSTYSPHGVYLDGGATLPDARGRGAYRALVRARWDEAVRRGTPALVVQAGAMSRPILERLGFRTLCEVRILVDDAA